MTLVTKARHHGTLYNYPFYTDLAVFRKMAKKILISRKVVKCDESTNYAEVPKLVLEMVDEPMQWLLSRKWLYPFSFNINMLTDRPSLRLRNK